MTVKLGGVYVGCIVCGFSANLWAMGYIVYGFCANLWAMGCIVCGLSTMPVKRSFHPSPPCRGGGGTGAKPPIR